MSEKTSYNVLNICSWYPNELKPTLGNFVQKHAEVISIKNKNIVLAIFPNEQLKKQKVDINQRGNLKEIIIYYPKLTKGFKIIRRIRNYFRHRKSFLTGYKLVKEEFGRPDIVHLNIVYPLGIWALWLKLIHGIPYVITENSSGFHMHSEHKYPKNILRLCKLIFRKANVILPVSENLKENIKVLAPKNKYALISNVVDEKLFTMTDENVDRNSKKLIHISTGVDEIKNLSGMIRVMKKIKSENLAIQLDIVSDGDIDYAMELARSLNVESNIFFHSTKTTTQIAEMISQSDALLMFSNYENFPCVIAEAMMCGKPIISTNVNGIPEHVLSSNGILVNPRDEIELFEAINKFMKEEDLFNSNEIRNYALKHFSYSSVSNQFQSVYRSTLQSK